MKNKLVYLALILIVTVSILIIFFQKRTVTVNHQQIIAHETFTYVDPILGTTISTNSPNGIPGEETYSKMKYDELVALVIKKCPTLTIPPDAEVSPLLDSTKGTVSFSYLDLSLGKNVYVNFKIPYLSEQVMNACNGRIVSEIGTILQMERK